MRVSIGGVGMLEVIGVVSRLPVVWRHRLRFGLQLRDRGRDQFQEATGSCGC